MFAWGSAIFRIDLWSANHLTGFALMTAATASAAAGFGLVLATLLQEPSTTERLCRDFRMVLSALGGSMVPRFVMPSFLDTTAMFTFNGWALDGYLKVFWYDDPAHTLLQSVVRLLPQLAMLSACAVIFLLIARLLARRWEAV